MKLKLIGISLSLVCVLLLVYCGYSNGTAAGMCSGFVGGMIAGHLGVMYGG